MFDLPVDRAVSGVVECLDLDLGLLRNSDEADILVFEKCLDFNDVLLRHNLHQRLCRRHHAADGMHCQLLHRAIHRRHQFQ